MGSRVMHAIIAENVSKKLEIQNVDMVLLGSIAADAATNNDISHYYQGDSVTYTRTINITKFIGDFPSFHQVPFLIGYFSHLVADELWLTGFYQPWLRNRLENNENLLNTYHHDFFLLNAKLCEFYDCKEFLIRHIPRTATIPTILSCDETNVLAFSQELLEDLNYTNEKINESLSVFTLQQIVGYIETSFEKTTYLINNLIQNPKGENS